MNKGDQKMLCSEVVVNFLVKKKLTHVFDLTGGMITYLEDAISRTKGIECVPVHHEQAAGFAAEGYARKGQNFGVALATSGPGATNLMTAIGSCYFDSVPVLFITGQVHTDNIKKNQQVRQEGFQETDIVSITQTITKYSVLVTSPKDILYELEKAYYIMKSGRPGPVVVDIPINIQRTEIEESKVRHFFGSKEHRVMEKKATSLVKTFSTKKVEAFKKMLAEAKAPLVLVGNGVRLSRTSKELARFVKNNNLPVVSSLLGIDSFCESKNYVGYIGSNGNRDANIVFANADLVIVLGSRLDVRQIGDPRFFNPKASLVHVDIDKSSINYMLQAKLSFEADLLEFFNAVQNIVTPPKQKWFSFIKNIQTLFSRELAYDSEVNPNSFFHELSKVASKTTTVAIDVGQNQMWCAQSWTPKMGQRLLFSGGMGAMGFALPASIGAWFADQKADLVVINGDGGIQINIQEMETVSRNNIPMKLFVLNNKSLGMVREFQDLYLNKNYQSTVKGYGYPNFKKLADAYGFDYVLISSLKKDDPILKDILAMKKPVLIEVDLAITAPLHPKVVYGHALDDQSPYLDEMQKKMLEDLKSSLYAS